MNSVNWDIISKLCKFSPYLNHNLLDSSKQRKKIRSKISKEKSGLENSLPNYNNVSPEPLPMVSLNAILNGKFPWKDESETSDEGNAWTLDVY